MNPDVPRIYLTFRCDLTCGYCSNGRTPAHYDELDADGWIQRVSCLKSGDLVFTGGEPTLHRDFYPLVNRLATTHRMTVYTNAAQPLTVRYLPVQPKGLSFRCSCHAQTPEEAEEWLEHVTAIRKAGYKVACTTVACPPYVLEVLRPHGINVDPLQRKPPPLAPPVRCTRIGRLIAPDGTRYHCVGTMVRKDPAGLVDYEAPQTIRCAAPNNCAACDTNFSKRMLCS